MIERISSFRFSSLPPSVSHYSLSFPSQFFSSSYPIPPYSLSLFPSSSLPHSLPLTFLGFRLSLIVPAPSFPSSFLPSPLTVPLECGGMIKISLPVRSVHTSKVYHSRVPLSWAQWSLKGSFQTLHLGTTHSMNASIVCLKLIKCY